jgi:hypothetical protein
MVKTANKEKMRIDEIRGVGKIFKNIARIIM